MCVDVCGCMYVCSAKETAALLSMPDAEWLLEVGASLLSNNNHNNHNYQLQALTHCCYRSSDGHACVRLFVMIDLHS